MEVVKDLLIIEIERQELKDLIDWLDEAISVIDNHTDGQGHVSDALAHWKVALKGMVK